MVKIENEEMFQDILDSLRCKAKSCKNNFDDNGYNHYIKIAASLTTEWVINQKINPFMSKLKKPFIPKKSIKIELPEKVSLKSELPELPADAIIVANESVHIYETDVKTFTHNSFKIH
jgi:hypothetical protein